MDFSVIDVDTSYNTLLGRPWMHKNTTIPSNYHLRKTSFAMCTTTISTAIDPFLKAEAYYAYASFYKMKSDQEKRKGAAKT